MAAEVTKADLLRMLEEIVCPEETPRDMLTVAEVMTLMKDKKVSKRQVVGRLDRAVAKGAMTRVMGMRVVDGQMRRVNCYGVPGGSLAELLE